MTKITEQLESLNQEEIKLIYETYSKAAENCKEWLDKTKNIISYTKALKDLTGAYFPEGETEVQTNEEVLEEKSVDLIADYTKAYEMYIEIARKFKPLVELLDEN